MKLSLKLKFEDLNNHFESLGMKLSPVIIERLKWLLCLKKIRGSRIKMFSAYLESLLECVFFSQCFVFSQSIKNREDENGTKAFFSVADRWPKNTDELLLLAFCPLFPLHVSQFVGGRLNKEDGISFYREKEKRHATMYNVLNWWY